MVGSEDVGSGELAADMEPLMSRRSTTLFDRQLTCLTGGVWPELALSPVTSPLARDPSMPSTPAPPPPPPPAWLGTADGLGAAAAGFETKGQRSVMEDALLIQQCEITKCTLLAVFDGHRGMEAAFYLRSHMQQHMEARWTASASAEALLAGALLDANADFNAEWTASTEQADGAKADRNPGSTALVALVYPAAAGGWRMAVAHVGDSRAVMCQDGKAVPLTVDHNGKRLDERSRVHKAGAAVRYLAGAWRFGKPALALTRSIGDADMKSLGIIAQAETCDVALDGSQECVVLATDGFWDMVSNEEAVELVRSFSGEPPAVWAERLVEDAVRRGTTDNTTVVVAKLHQG